MKLEKVAVFGQWLPDVRAMIFDTNKSLFENKATYSKQLSYHHNLGKQKNSESKK